MAAKSADARVLSNNSHQNNNWDSNGGADCRDMNHNIDAEDRNNNGYNYNGNCAKFQDVLSHCLSFSCKFLFPVLAS